MLSLSTGHIIGIVATLIAITVVGIYAGRKVKTAADFSVGGRKASAAVVAGTIMGTLVGGASTIGTAQLAFQFGACAWWFTLGAGIACAVLGLGLSKPLHDSRLETVPQYLVVTYGSNIGPVSSIFSSIGIFLSIVSQGLAAVALLTSMFNIEPLTATIIGILLVLGYVFYGGVWGTGLVGVAKLGLLYVATIVCGVIAYNMVGGYAGLAEKFTYFPWFSLFGRSFNLDAAAGFSLVVGVISTQTYIQAIYSGKDAQTSRRGAMISAFLIPPIGIGGILVGLYMRAYFPATPSIEVLPVFIMKFLPPWAGGVVLATMLVAVIGTWAGLALGVSTMVTKDIYKRFFRKLAGDKEILFVQRLLIFLVCVLCVFFVTGNLKSLILGWSFLSMGLRGCTILFPLLGAMFFPRLVSPIAGILAAFLGPLANLVWHVLYPKGLDPLYPGLIVSLVVLVLVSVIFPRRSQQTQTEAVS
ncbi:MAG: sodium:solute symporter family protein [Syntrophales bacterium]|jgi:SSS family solute:Na+ symporter